MFSRLAAVLFVLILLGSSLASWGQARADAPTPVAPIEAWLSADGAQRDGAGPADRESADESTPASSELEGGSDLPEGIASLAVTRIEAVPPARPRPLDAAPWRAPILDGLRRPPRAGLPAA